MISSNRAVVDEQGKTLPLIIILMVCHISKNLGINLKNLYYGEI